MLTSRGGLWSCCAPDVVILCAWCSRGGEGPVVVVCAPEGLQLVFMYLHNVEVLRVMKRRLLLVLWLISHGRTKGKKVPRKPKRRGKVLLLRSHFFTLSWCLGLT
jgi:hypothetical protein